MQTVLVTSLSIIVRLTMISSTLAVLILLIVNAWRAWHCQQTYFLCCCTKTCECRCSDVGLPRKTDKDDNVQQLLAQPDCRVYEEV